MQHLSIISSHTLHDHPHPGSTQPEGHHVNIGKTTLSAGAAFAALALIFGGASIAYADEITVTSTTEAVAGETTEAPAPAPEQTTDAETGTEQPTEATDPAPETSPADDTGTDAAEVVAPDPVTITSDPAPAPAAPAPPAGEEQPIQAAAPSTELTTLATPTPFAAGDVWGPGTYQLTGDLSVTSGYACPTWHIDVTSSGEAYSLSFVFGTPSDPDALGVDTIFVPAGETFNYTTPINFAFNSVGWGGTYWTTATVNGTSYPPFEIVAEPCPAPFGEVLVDEVQCTVDGFTVPVYAENAPELLWGGTDVTLTTTVNDVDRGTIALDALNTIDDEGVPDTGFKDTLVLSLAKSEVGSTVALKFGGTVLDSAVVAAGLDCDIWVDDPPEPEVTAIIEHGPVNGGTDYTGTVSITNPTDEPVVVTITTDGTSQQVTVPAGQTAVITTPSLCGDGNHQIDVTYGEDSLASSGPFTTECDEVDPEPVVTAIITHGPVDDGAGYQGTVSITNPFEFDIIATIVVDGVEQGVTVPAGETAVVTTPRLCGDGNHQIDVEFDGATLATSGEFTTNCDDGSGSEPGKGFVVVLIESGEDANGTQPILAYLENAVPDGETEVVPVTVRFDLPGDLPDVIEVLESGEKHPWSFVVSEDACVFDGPVTIPVYLDDSDEPFVVFGPEEFDCICDGDTPGDGEGDGDGSGDGSGDGDGAGSGNSPGTGNGHPVSTPAAGGEGTGVAASGTANLPDKLASTGGDKNSINNSNNRMLLVIAVVLIAFSLVALFVHRHERRAPAKGKRSSVS